MEALPPLNYVTNSLIQATARMFEEKPRVRERETVDIQFFSLHHYCRWHFILQTSPRCLKESFILLGVLFKTFDWRLVVFLWLPELFLMKLKRLSDNILPQLLTQNSRKYGWSWGWWTDHQQPQWSTQIKSTVSLQRKPKKQSESQHCGCPFWAADGWNSIFLESLEVRSSII